MGGSGTFPAIRPDGRECHSISTEWWGISRTTLPKPGGNSWDHPLLAVTGVVLDIPSQCFLVGIWSVVRECSFTIT